METKAFPKRGCVSGHVHICHLWSVGYLLCTVGLSFSGPKKPVQSISIRCQVFIRSHIKGGFGRRSIVVSVFEVFLFLRCSCRLAVSCTS